MNRLPFIILLSFTLIYSCKESTKEANYSASLSYGDDITFKLDSLTSFSANNPIFLNGQWCFFNSINNSIKCFDSDFKMEKTIDLPVSGPNSLVSPMGITTDGNSIYVSDYAKNTLDLIDNEGKVILDYYLQPDELENSTHISTGLSQIKIDEQFIYVTFQGNHNNNKSINHSDPTIVRINKFDSTKALFLNYPSNYQNLITGGRQSIIATTYNSKTKSLIVSFPLDHRVFELKNDGSMREHMAKSDQFDDFDGHYFNSLTSATNFKTINDKYLGNHSYWLIHYDKYTDTYIRFVNLPLEKHQMDVLNPDEATLRKYKAILLNSNFQKIGESEILKDINLELTQAKVFTTEDGVHVFAKNQENEDVMRFKTLKITYK